MSGIARQQASETLNIYQAIANAVGPLACKDNKTGAISWVKRVIKMMKP